MKPFLSLGIDPSISGTGVVLLKSADQIAKPYALYEQSITATPGAVGLQRTREIVFMLMKLIHEWNPHAIVVEGYSLNTKNVSSIVPLVELGGLLRVMMMLDGFKWYDPRASQVKQFATGKGNAPKDKMMMNVLKHWGHESKDNNTADAYVLAAMGLAAANRLKGATVDMRMIAGKMERRCN